MEVVGMEVVGMEVVGMEVVAEMEEEVVMEGVVEIKELVAAVAAEEGPTKPATKPPLVVCMPRNAGLPETLVPAGARRERSRMLNRALTVATRLERTAPRLLPRGPVVLRSASLIQTQQAPLRSLPLNLPRRLSLLSRLMVLRPHPHPHHYHHSRLRLFLRALRIPPLRLVPFPMRMVASSHRDATMTPRQEAKLAALVGGTHSARLKDSTMLPGLSAVASSAEPTCC